MSDPSGEVKTLNLALQGGGAHGAFTWGVLDRILQDRRLTIEAISGTSAGAMNAAVLAHGLAEGGRDGARAALDHFWHRVGEAASGCPNLWCSRAGRKARRAGCEPPRGPSHPG